MSEKLSEKEIEEFTRLGVIDDNSWDTDWRITCNWPDSTKAGYDADFSATYFIKAA